MTELTVTFAELRKKFVSESMPWKPEKVPEQHALRLNPPAARSSLRSPPAAAA